MQLSDTTWSEQDTQQALDEGWMVFNDTEIQRDDEAGVFACDEDAIEHVRERAAAGSAMHQTALAVHEANCATARD